MDGVNAFDEAVEGVDGIAHTASAVRMTASLFDWVTDDHVKRAVKSTSGLLNSIDRNNPTLKRVVMTSSVNAVSPSNVSNHTPGHLYTGDDWNTDAVGDLSESDRFDDGLAYPASLIEAERAFWSYTDKNKTSWDPVVLCPSFVLGDLIHEGPDPKTLNYTAARMYAYMTGCKSEADLVREDETVFSFVNVRDVADAHVRAMGVSEPSQRRLLITSHRFAQQDLCDLLHQRYPDIPNVPIGKPGGHDEIVKKGYEYDNMESKHILEMGYASLEDTLVATVDSLRCRFGV